MNYQLAKEKMKEVILLSLLFYGALSLSAPKDPLSDEFIDHINSLQTTWKAGRNFAVNIPTKYMKTTAAVNFSGSGFNLTVRDASLSVTRIPKEFDARERWPYCPTIAEIRDQGPCGSCWAVGATATMSDRICIHSKGKTKVRLSENNLLACCDTCGFGCDGGFLPAAWSYWKNDGIVSGGPYGSTQGCQPYSIGSCNNVIEIREPHCDGLTPVCKKQCRSDYHNTYTNDLNYGREVYSIRNDPKVIQTEILMNGPVEAAFTVYEDFFCYKKGVYQHVAGQLLGGHAVRIIGWGTENNTPYWLIANSWNTYWGENGFFKILRGNNECGIEDQIVAGLPRV